MVRYWTKRPWGSIYVSTIQQWGRCSGYCGGGCLRRIVEQTAVGQPLKRQPTVVNSARLRSPVCFGSSISF